MPENPVIDIQLQSNSPTVQIAIDKPEEIKLIEIEDKKWSNSQITIIAASSTKTFDYSNKVPEGYTCIGCVKPTLTHVTSATKRFEYNTGAVFVCRNTSSNTALKSNGIETVSGFTRCYYIIKTTLVCTRNSAS